MPRKAASTPGPIPPRDSVPDLIRRLEALDVYETGNSLACKAAKALKRLAAENKRLKKGLKGSD